MHSSDWTVADSIDLYNIERWGRGYFTVNSKGNLVVTPSQEPQRSLELIELVQEAQERGLHLPMLVRFQDILRHRVIAVNQRFQDAISELHYRGRYTGVFPIKVNQLREVVEEIHDTGRPFDFGLEVGSKPEMFAALALHDIPEALLVCNGYKDTTFIRLALMGRKLGRRVIIVVEKLEELRLILKESRSMEVDPLIGIRVRLATQGTGKWALSGGENAKFGLSTADLMTALDLLRSENRASCFQMLHFHVGSQVPDIQTIKRAVREAARIFCKLHQMGFHLSLIDVGGGLGIDYNGSCTCSESSTNYSMAEYARDVVHNIAEVCNEENVPHPDIVSESGRAIVAHHSVLLLNVFGTIEKTNLEAVKASDQDHRLLINLAEIRAGLTAENKRESYHDALQIKEECSQRFDLGLLDLPTKARIEAGFWELAHQVIHLHGPDEPLPEEFEPIALALSHQFLCNFSVFQSLIDHWAVGQLFPIAPIHRLNTRPELQATLVDITCDSDGKIDKFIDDATVRDTLPLHRPDGQPYILGVFLVGAYQDVMGDLHNLFGPLPEVHVFLDEDEPSGYYIEEIIPGYTNRQVLEDVQYDAKMLIRLMKQKFDHAIRQDLIKPKEGMRLLEEYTRGLDSPTYLQLNP